MSRDEILTNLFKSNAVHNIIRNIDGNMSSYDRDDLASIVYESLLRKDEDFIIGLHGRGELPFYVIRILQNNIRSNTSPYFRQIKKFDSLSEDIRNYTDKL